MHSVCLVLFDVQMYHRKTNFSPPPVSKLSALLVIHPYAEPFWTGGWILLYSGTPSPRWDPTPGDVYTVKVFPPLSERLNEDLWKGKLPAMMSPKRFIFI